LYFYVLATQREMEIKRGMENALRTQISEISHRKKGPEDE
jgi:hypothetical protein